MKYLTCELSEIYSNFDTRQVSYFERVIKRSNVDLAEILSTIIISDTPIHNIWICLKSNSHDIFRHLLKPFRCYNARCIYCYEKCMPLWYFLCSE